MLEMSNIAGSDVVVWRTVVVQPIALIITVGGKRSLNPDLLQAWYHGGEGSKCPRCAAVVELGWGWVFCPRCDQEWMDLQGCQCGGDVVCVDCLWTRTITGDEHATCTKDCDGLCPVHCPDS